MMQGIQVQKHVQLQGPSSRTLPFQGTMEVGWYKGHRLRLYSTHAIATIKKRARKCLMLSSLPLLSERVAHDQAMVRIHTDSQLQGHKTSPTWKLDVTFSAIRSYSMQHSMHSAVSADRARGASFGGRGCGSTGRCQTLLLP